MNEIELVRESLARLMPYVAERYSDRSKVSVWSKSEANDLLTEVDEEVQRRLTKLIGEAFPGDDILGEELGMSGMPANPKGRCWILDPIDGTQNFVRGLFPAFGISIAFAEGGQVRAGGVGMPMTGDVFLAERGRGAARNGNPLSVSSVDALGLARVEIDFGNPAIREETLARFTRLAVGAGQVRCHCAAVVGLCSVATGDMDGYFHVALAPWDYAAAALIVEEAGGRVTHLDGSPLDLFGANKSLLATNGRIHEESLNTVDSNAAGRAT